MNAAPGPGATGAFAQARVTEHAEGFACELPGGARALFSSRAHANLSIQTGDGHEHGRRARDCLCESLGQRWLCASRQVHGATVQRVLAVDGRGGEPVAIDADGHATSVRGIGAMVLTADCLPVALASDGAVAMLHAGWRGLAAGVLEEGVRALRHVGGDGAIVAVVGPGAGACCYEVGPEVHATFGASVPGVQSIDLRAIARDRLLGAGVAQVLDARACTICDARFFSHRREGSRAGRQAGVAWLS
ncbi:MAG TPA: polyphenol oxidase family protein [Solirubrobacteraceae bacterium]|nr:polyphenol oxidase family protein [Solirubrobacteraceae bacterium]